MVVMVVRLLIQTMQNVIHIDIPYDELGVFKTSQDKKYDEIYAALLLSTIASIHQNKKVFKSSFFVTMKSIWIIKKEKVKAIIPVRSIVAVAKSHKHPEMAIITRENVDNLRITTSAEERCWYIVSALSYIFTYAMNCQLCFISVKNDVLDYFQRTVEDKQKRRNVNIDSYAKQYISYKKPFKDITDIFGFIKPRSKIILQKQLETVTADQKQSHLVYLARIKNQHEESKSKIGGEEYGERFICHYIQKKQQYLQQIYEHKNIDFITELIYAKATEYKIQMFFEFSKPLRGFKIIPIVFKQIWQLYDRVKAAYPTSIFTTDSILVVERSKEEKNVRKSFVIEDDDQLWNKGEISLVIKQLRYEFLKETTEWDRFLYESDDQQAESKDYNKKFHKKCYNIGLILYQLVMGRNLLSYIPAIINEQQVVEEQIILLIQFKEMLHKGNFQMFPKFMELGVEEYLKDFIKLCIYRKFKNEEQLWEHQWFSKKAELRRSRKSSAFQQ